MLGYLMYYEVPAYFLNKHTDLVITKFIYQYVIQEPGGFSTYQINLATFFPRWILAKVNNDARLIIYSYEMI